MRDLALVLSADNKIAWMGFTCIPSIIGQISGHHY